jgi:hypothetical protein
LLCIKLIGCYSLGVNIERFLYKTSIFI